jgi:beta-aspartyl-peptidase (threonine type)
MVWALVIHGGAGTIRRDLESHLIEEARAGLVQALDAGRAILERGGTALDAVEAAVAAMEDHPHFNAGKGSVFHRGGGHEFDAAIMDGSTQNAGSVGGVSRIKNAITLARRVMENTPHRLVVGKGAEDFAEEMGLVLEEDAYFFTERRHAQWQRLKNKNPQGLSRSEDESGDEGDPPSGDAKGTVGAVALDEAGHLAAATSTGGLTNKMEGRVGDTGLVGAGTWAEDGVVAISCTGHGEAFMHHMTAHAVALRIKLLGENLKAATDALIHEEMERGKGGLIAVDGQGNIAMPFSSKGMYRGTASSDGSIEIKIWDEE